MDFNEVLNLRLLSSSNFRILFASRSST